MALRYYVSTEEASFFVNNKMGSSDRIPTSGTYKVGDFIISNTQANGVFGWVCTQAGTPGTWIEIGTGGSNTKTLSLSSSTVVSSPVREVAIGIKDFNKGTDFLMVYKNSTYLTEGVDYDISSDSTKIISRTGNWNVDSLGDYRFSFVVIKEVEKVSPEAVVGTENLKDSVVTMTKLGEDVIERLDGVDSQLEHNTKYPTPKKYGAKGDGVTDDTQAIIKALNNENHISISDGIYKITSNIKLAPRKTISGDSSGTILIDSANNFTVFGITYLNEVYGFNVKQTNELWGGNIFEVSSATLEDTDAPIYVNLRNKIHDINLETNSNYGTFIEISAYKYDDVDSSKQYRVYGLWNNNVYNIQHKGYLEYFCRTYCYKKIGTSETPWITDNKFSNINGDYYGYGWFGSKNEHTKLNLEYSNYNINVSNSVIQCYTKSKNFAYITGGYTKFTDCIPYDWSAENESKQNAFAIRYSDNLPQIVINGTSGNFDVENYNLTDKYYIINQCILNNNGISNYKETNSFPIGYAGGTTYPKYIRIARFYPYESSYSCNIRFHIEASDRVCSNYSLTYLKSSKKLTSKYENDNIGVSFLYNEDSKGYINIYMKITSSVLPWFMSYDTPPEGASSKSFIYMSLEYLDSLDESELTECVPVQKQLMLPNLNNISATGSNGGLIGYDNSKGMLGFGRKHYGVSYIPIIETQEFTASSTSETVVFNNPKWGLTPKVIIQPLSDISSIPYPSNVSVGNQSFTINKAEVGKKYLIIIIYT